MKTTRLIDILDRISRGLSTVIDAREVRNELIDLYEIATKHGENGPNIYSEYGTKANALRDLRL